MYNFFHKKDSFLLSSEYLVSILHRNSNCFPSVSLSCKLFLYSLSKDLILYWTFSICFLDILQIRISISYVTFLLIVYPHALSLFISITFKPIPVGDNVTELDVLAKITKESIDFNGIFFEILFWFTIFISEICNHFSNASLWVIKTIHIVNVFLLFSVLNHCFLMAQRDIILI